MRGLIKRLIDSISAIGASPGDSEDVRLQKSLLVISALPFAIAGAIWGTLYICWGEPLAGMIPLTYSVFSLISIFYFKTTHRYATFRFSQLMLILLLPFFLMLGLGGFINGSAVILWSLLSPLGALLFDKQSHSPRWLIGFAALLVISMIVQPWLGNETSLTPGQIRFFFLMNLTCVGLLTFMMVYYFVSKRNFFQARSESLLLNILPAPIAEELKQKGSVEARLRENVTVMFTDFVDFSKRSATLSPAALVSEIDACFKAFDGIMERYGIEKIKTIGDSYMAAGGLSGQGGSPSIDVVRAALDIQAFIQQHAAEQRKQQNAGFEIRIGIHTGSVVAGVVGFKKFAYDIWGETVNLASRLESSSEPGKVNISGTTYEQVKEFFACSYRGKIKTKNMGEVDMYFVLSPIDAKTPI